MRITSLNAINKKTGSSFKHIAQSYSDIESTQFAELISDHFFHRKRKANRIKTLLSDLLEERQIKDFLRNYDQLIDHSCLRWIEFN